MAGEAAGRPPVRPERPAPRALARALASPALPVALAIGFLIAAATHLNLVKSIWLDETFTLDRTGRSLAETLDQARFTSLKPPVYFLLTHYWRTFDSSIEFVRLLSTGAIAGAALVLDRVSRVLEIGRGWRSVAILAALAPHFIWAGAEARHYALVLLFLSLGFLFWARLFVRESTDPWRDGAWFVLWNVLAILTFYYAGFVVAAQFVAAIPARRWRAWFATGAAIALALAPWIPLVHYHVTAQAGSYLPDVAAAGGPGLTGLAFLRDTLIPVWFHGSPLMFRPAAAGAVAALVGGLFLVRLVSTRPRWTRLELQLALLAGTGLALLFAVRVLNLTHADQRHWIVTAPGALLFLVATSHGIRPPALSRLGWAALVAVFALAATSFVRNERGSIDFRSAARYIHERERAGQPILVFLTNPAGFAYYYRGPNVFRRFPEDQLTFKDGGTRIELTPIERRRLAGLIGHATGDDPSFWVLEVPRQAKLPPVLEEVLGYRPEETDRITFRRANVYRLKLREPLTGR
jgi:mannosyltransferase